MIDAKEAAQERALNNTAYVEDEPGAAAVAVVRD